MTAAQLEIRQLSKSFGNTCVLDRIDLTLRSGDCLALIGESGTGKSVFLKCLLGLLAPDSGSVFLDGIKISDLRGARRQRIMRRFGMVFQNAALFDSLPVWRNVAFGLLHPPDPKDRLSRAEARSRAEIWLERVGIEPRVADADPASLSGGMRKRVGLARAAATEPDILLLDEPTTGLDPVTADVINSIITDCTHRLGATVIAATHDMTGIRRIADRVAMLDSGMLCWQGSVAALDQADHPRVAQFLRLAKSP